ncbi:g9830 [Coccomyxa viridis]|uniref:G9830 protein n=1 Tax=Coccomyxa viridis TaxID=1274662 RepID=A0ABP1G850_9CHLO
MPEVALKVAMACSGCEGAVRRVLQNKPGVQSVDIDLAQQKVLVTGDVSQEDILQTVSKTGKKTELWQ